MIDDIESDLGEIGIVDDDEIILDDAALLLGAADCAAAGLDAALIDS